MQRNRLVYWQAIIATIATLTLGACESDTPGGDPPEGDGANVNPLCNPVAAGDCFLPYPSSFYMKKDAATRTGYRINIPEGVLPINQVGAHFDAERYNRFDGYSPATQLLANLKARIDPAKLPTHSLADYSASLAATSTVQLFEFDTGKRVPLFAEVDMNVVNKPDEDQVLLIHPIVKLRTNARYVVALQNLTSVDGNKIVIKPFAALVAGDIKPGSRLEEVKAVYDEIFTMLSGQGISKDALTLAWDFRTASDEESWGNVIAMRDHALKRWKDDDLGYTVTKDDIKDPSDKQLHRVITGTFKVPSFLSDDKSPFSGLNFGADGKVKPNGNLIDAKFVVNIPKCAEKATLPLPIMIYGHGLFGDAQETVNSAMRFQSNELCMIYIGTNWIGLSVLDETYVVATVFSNFDTFWFVTDRLQQAQINFVILARLAKQKFKDMKELQIGGKPVVDGKEIYYHGNSQGGIEGGVFMSITPDIERGVLGVPGGVYSLMLTRSSDFKDFKDVMDFTYPNQRDQEVMLLLAQSLWDQSDPIGYIGHAIKAPFNDPDTGKPMAPKKLLFHEGRYDAEVPNVANNIVGREAGVKLLNPPTYDVYLMEAADGPLDSAYVSYDIHPTPIPDGTNVPGVDNDAHGAIRRLPEAIEQMRQFLKPDGKIVNTCNNQPCEKGKGIK